MTVRVNKSAFNIREKLSELAVKFGLKGTELARAETVQDARDLISAGRKNIVINGDMVFAQRQTSVTLNPAQTAYYSLDRMSAWNYPNTATAVATWTKDGPSFPDDGDMAPGFTSYGRYTTTTAQTSLGTNTFAGIQYLPEGYDLGDLKWGTPEARSSTLSFWVRSSIPGSYSFNMQLGASSVFRYTVPYNINDADVWEKKVIHIPAFPQANVYGVTAGVGLGVYLFWPVALGTTYLASTEGLVTSGNQYGITGLPNLLGTLNATFDLTGIQWEVGDNATDFEYLNYGEQLRLCQRYFQIVPLTNALAATATQIHGNYSLMTDMRVQPTVGLQGPIEVNDNVVNSVQSSAVIVNYGTGKIKFVQLNNFSSLTASNPAFMRFNANNNLLTLRAEIQ